MESTSRQEKLIKNTVILSIGTFLPKLAAFITLPILTGMLTKEEYGTVDLITVLVSLLLPAATLEIQTAAFRFLIDERKNRKAISTIITNIYLFILPTSLIALIIFYFFLPGQTTAVRFFMCLYFLADILVSTTRQVCRGLNRTKDYTVSAIISACCKVVLILVLIQCLHLGLLGTVIALFASSTISLVYLLLKDKILTYIDFKSFDKHYLMDMLKYSWPMVPNSMSAWVMRVSDRLVVTAIMGIEANAVYAVANKLPSLLNIAQKTFTMAWQENAAIVSKDEDAEQYYSLMFHKILDFLAGFFCILIAGTPILFKLLIHGDYDEAYSQIPILFLAMFFLGMSTYLGGIFLAYKKSKSIGLTTVAAAIINIVVDLCLIRHIGLYAASGSTLVSYIILFVFRMITVKKIVDIKYDYTHLIFMIILVTGISGLCFIQNKYINILNIVIGLITFCKLNKDLLLLLKKKAGKVISIRGKKDGVR